MYEASRVRQNATTSAGVAVWPGRADPNWERYIPTSRTGRPPTRADVLCPEAVVGERLGNVL